MIKQELNVYFLKVFALLLTAFLFVISLANFSSQDDDFAVYEYDFEAQYGSALDDFYYLSESFQARWLSEKEDDESDCLINKHCVFIKVASVASCEKGAVVKFSVLDGESRVLGTAESEVFLTLTGKIVQLELGSPLLTKKGFIEPIDAYCKGSLPAA